MRIEVVDPSGHGLGTAIGLLELGHEVHYVPAHSPRDGDREMGRMKRELIERMFGGCRTAAQEPDLLVLVDVFADYLQCLEDRVGLLGREVTDPLQDDGGVLVYPKRLQYFCERAKVSSRVAVIDMSDSRELREVAFEALPHVQLFARETHGAGDGAWRPFPFLYNLAMLWVEYMLPQADWLVTLARPRQWDWVFCGTLGHERYGRRREVAIALLAERWPNLRGAVLAQLSFREVLGALQSVRFGLDLAGIGELCFRMHECLALGTPVWRPLSKHVRLPAGLSSVVKADPALIPDMDVESVRAIYAQHYGPTAAASWLLRELKANAHQYWMYQATNIAATASK